MLPPSFDQHFCFSEIVEELDVQELIAKFSIEALIVAVLPGGARFNEQRLRSNLCDPIPNGMSCELRPIVGPDVIGHTPLNHEISQDGENALAVEPSRHVDGQTLPSELIDHGEHTELTAVTSLVLNEVIGSDMVRTLWPQPDAGTIVEPQPPALRLLLRNTKALPPPDPSNTLVVHMPAVAPK